MFRKRLRCNILIAMGRLVVILLVLVGIAAGQEGFFMGTIKNLYYSARGKLAKCPGEIEFVGEKEVECERVCSVVKEKGGYQYSEVVQKPLDYSREVPVPRVCVCRLADKPPNGGDPPFIDVICGYIYTLDSPDSDTSGLSSITIANDVPSRLVRLFTFRAHSSVPVSPEGAVALGGFYSVYVEIIRGWTSFFALALVVIVAGWNMVLPAVGGVIQKIRHRETDIPAISAESLVRVAMAVIPAAGFFALPVPVGREGMIFMDNVIPEAATFSVIELQTGRTENVSGLLSTDGDGVCVYYRMEADRLRMGAQAARQKAQEYRSQGAMSPEQASQEYERFRSELRDAEERFKQRMDTLKERVKQRLSERLTETFLGRAGLNLPSSQINYISASVDNLAENLASICINNALNRVMQYIQGVITSYTYQVVEELLKNLLRQETGIDPTGFISAMQAINAVAEEAGKYCGINNAREVVWQVYAGVVQEITAELEGELRVATEEYAREIARISERYRNIHGRVDNWVLAESYENTAESLDNLAQVAEEKGRECQQMVAGLLEENRPYDESGGGWRDNGHGRRFVLALYRKGDTAYLPLAVGVVGSFVDFGLEGAKAVASAVNGIINAYQSVKLNQSINAMEQAKAQNRQYWQRVMETESRLDQIMGNSAAECGLTKCDDVLKKNLEAVTMPKCVEVYHYARAYCSMLKQYGERLERMQEGDEQAQQIQQRITQVTSGISDAFTWISPAILTQAPLYSMFVGLSSKDQPSTKLRLIYKSEATPEVDLRVASSGSAAVKALNEGQKTLNSLDVNVGLSRESFYFYGMALAITGMPPGSMIRSAISEPVTNVATAPFRLLEWIGERLEKAPNAVGFALMGIGGGGLGKIAGAAVGMLISTMIAYVVTVILLKALPFLVVSGVVIFRFIAYLFDLAKFMITLPFFAVGAATRRPEAALQFFGHTLKLATTPILIAFMPLVAFVAIELVSFFFFTVPMYFILSGTSLYDSMLAYFFAGMFNGFLFVASTIIAVVVAWDTATSFIDGVYAYVNNMVGAYYSSGERLAGAAKGFFVGRLG